MPLIIAFVIFSLIVVIHEFGHFIVARKNGIIVEEFAIGMGPLIYGKKKGDTLYSIRVLPIGGYCKMLGEDSNEYDDGSFNNKTVFQRIAVISAGAVMNFILAFVLVLILVFTNGFATLNVASVIDNSPAASADIQPGDKIISIDNKPLRIFQDVQFALMNNGGNTINVTIERNGERIVTELTPVFNGQIYTIGFYGMPTAGLFSSNPQGLERAGIFESIVTSFWTGIHYIRMVIYGLIQLVTFNVGMDDMTGPVGILNLIDDTYQASRAISLWTAVTRMMTLAAIISVNLGVFNLMPFPALDGGRLVFLFIEAVRGKPVSPDKEGIVHLVGFALLMTLAIVVTFNDIIRIF